MGKINIFCLLLILIFATPIVAQEAADETPAAVEDVITNEWMDEGVVTGNVVSVDSDSGTVTVALEEGDKTFNIVGGETILWKGIEDIELSDVSVGEEAEVGYYTDESGNLVASWVDVLIEEISSSEIDSGETETAPQE